MIVNGNFGQVICDDSRGQRFCVGHAGYGRRVGADHALPVSRAAHVHVVAASRRLLSLKPRTLPQRGGGSAESGAFLLSDQRPARAPLLQEPTVNYPSDIYPADSRVRLDNEERLREVLLGNWKSQMCGDLFHILARSRSAIEPSAPAVTGGATAHKGRGEAALRGSSAINSGLLLALAIGVFSPAQAADRDWSTCSGPISTASISACSRLIASGDTHGGKPAFAYYNRGSAWLEMGEYARAIDDFDAAIRLDPSSAWTFNNRGSAWYAKGDLDRAMADFSQAVTLDPGYALAYNNRAEVWKERGDGSRAIADYSEAIAIDPSYTAAYANRGVAYERMGDVERARADFDSALASPPKYSDGQKAQDIARRRLAALAAAEPRPTKSPVSPPPSLAGVSGRRIALVIGNSAYMAVPALHNPRRDSELVAAAFRNVGFEAVTISREVTRESLIEALRAFSRDAQHADWAVVYYSGHGVEVNGVNYLVPVDARLDSDRDVPLEAVSLDQVMAAVEGAHELRLVLLDACRDNPFLARMRPSGMTRSISRGLAPPQPASGTLVVYAAKDGQAAFDGDAGDSPFAAALAKRLATPGVEIGKLFRLIRDDVIAATGGRQEPFTYGSLPGGEDYYFVAK
jgi:tetratricopeptide (TPR) repeat protein